MTSPDELRFTDFKFHASILNDIAAAGYEKPTPVQAACMGPAMEGKDLIGVAQTGTGKTAAFALPIINRLANRLELGALVLAPTRELAAQITGVFRALGASSGIRVATIVGGTPMDGDHRALKSWPNVLVATPGRLIDHLDTGTLKLGEIEVLTIDEADRMHDMGFIPQIRRILSALPAQRQTLMFTATMPAEVERIARLSMRDPARIQVGMRCVPVEGAQQQLFEVTEEEKTGKLVQLLREANRGRVLVFLRTKRGVDRLGRTLSAKNIRAARIHGDREQCERDEAMAGFRSGKYRVLLATDIAARGIDIADIEHVINYDFPRHAEDYVHRIGRTARQQATGLATTLVTRADRRYLSELKKLLGAHLPDVIGSTGQPVAAHEGSDDGYDSHGEHAGRPDRSRRSGRGFSRGRGGDRPAQAGGHVSGHTSHHVVPSGPVSAASQHEQAPSADAVSTGMQPVAGAAPGIVSAGTVAGAQQGAEGRKRRRRRGGRGRKGATQTAAASSQVDSSVPEAADASDVQ